MQFLCCIIEFENVPHMILSAFLLTPRVLKQDTVMLSLAPLLGRNLRELDLTYCVYLTDLSVRAIATYLPELVVLRLGWCKEISDWGLLGMVEPTKDCEPRDKEVGLPVF